MTACSERYYLERIMKHKVPFTPAPWLALGIAWHESFVEWERSERKIDVCEYFEKSYDESIESLRLRQPDMTLWQMPPGTKSIENSIKNYRNRGLERDVPEYRDRCLEAEWEIYRFEDGVPALEVEFELDLDGLVVKGALDRVQWWPSRGYATVEDGKTGSIDGEADVRQLGLYGYAANSELGIPLKYGRYWFSKLNRGGEWVDLSRYTKEYLTKTYHALDDIISQGLFLPNPGKHCGLCGVKPYCRELGDKSV